MQINYILGLREYRITRRGHLETVWLKNGSLDSKPPEKAIPPPAGRNGILSRRGKFALLNLSFCPRVSGAEFLTVFKCWPGTFPCRKNF